MALTVDPSNKEHLFVSSGGRGLLEFQDGNVVNHYDDINSTLKQQFGNPGQVKVHGIRMDDEGNIWATNAGVNTVLNARLPSGQWIAYSFAGISNSKAGDLVIDQNGGKWLTLFENSGGSDGLLYFNDNGTPSDLSDDESAPISFASNRVRSLIVDNDGTLWVGLDAGLRVIYPPSIQPQQIIIKQDGAFQYLLETESVTAFAVDGANRKWIGTENAGVFLFSAVHHRQ
jgi:ligand-binding sensor domain-containing protein